MWESRFARFPRSGGKPAVSFPPLLHFHSSLRSFFRGSLAPDCHTRSPAGMRSGHRMLKWFNAAFQFGIGIVHFFTALRNARYNNFRAASSFGNEPRILMILRSDMFSDSTALVV